MVQDLRKVSDHAWDDLLLESPLVKHVLSTEPVEVALLKRFTHVMLEDSSSIVLPAELEELWPGFGGEAEGTTGQAEASL